MKKNLAVFIFLFLNFFCLYGQNNLDSLLSVIDKKIMDKNVYMRLKDQRIEHLKVQRKEVKNTPTDLYMMNNILFNEYKNYVSDSAIYYLNENLDIADGLNDTNKITETKTSLSLLFVRLGMYKEASDLLNDIQVMSLNSQRKLNYYIAFRDLYLGLGKYSQNNRERHNYWKKANRLNDSVKILAGTGSEEYLKMTEKSSRLNNQFQRALNINDQRLKLTKPSTALYALVTFQRSLIYRAMQDIENEKKYLALSTISDINLAIKDIASISVLADILSREGQINRAYKYIRFSLENIKDYNTRIRSSEVLDIQAIIDKEYQIIKEKNNQQLRALLVFSGILLLLLIISIVHLYQQMKKGQTFSLKLKEANLELEVFNSKLHEMNNELITRNLEVAEANHIKEEYIAYFLDACSNYIVKLDSYRKMVHKKLQEKKYEELFKITKDTGLKEEEMKELFINFDSMFVKLFPSFLKEFNTLLLEEERIYLKKEEKLNVELRIFALIRLGISDSSRIANFLGYSVNTIYNYRTKMKNKSHIARDHFEFTVKRIGAFI